MRLKQYQMGFKENFFRETVKSKCIRALADTGSNFTFNMSCKFGFCFWSLVATEREREKKHYTKAYKERRESFRDGTRQLLKIPVYFTLKFS
jgi:hypothetical protein